MKISIIIITTLFLLVIGLSNRLNTPVALTHKETLKAMETFFPETRPPIRAKPATTNAVELMRKRQMERAAQRDREEWAKLTAKFRGASKEKANGGGELVANREEEEEESIQQDYEEVKEVVVVEEEDVVGEEQGSGEVEKRFYSQLELSEMEASKRKLLNWVMQMEYAGQTFFDGYVFSCLFSIFLNYHSPLRHLHSPRRRRRGRVAPCF